MVTFIRSTPAPLPQDSGIRPEDTLSAVRKVLHLPDLAVGIAEHLPDQDRVNFAATDRALRSILDCRPSLWKVPEDHTPLQQTPVARLNWFNAWSERAKLSPPELRAALKKTLVHRPGEAQRVGAKPLELPDIFSAPYVGVEILVWRARRLSRDLGNDGAPFISDIEQRDLTVAAACRFATRIGLDLRHLPTDLDKLEARVRMQLYIEFALSDAREGRPEAMERDLRRARELAAIAGEAAPDVPEDLRLEAYAKGMTTCQANVLQKARVCDVFGFSNDCNAIERFAKRIGIPAPNPMPAELVQACREGLEEGMRQAARSAKHGRIEAFDCTVKMVQRLADLAGLTAPIVSPDLIREAHTKGRDLAMERASDAAQRGDAALMEAYIADSHALADKARIPRHELSPDVEQLGYRNAATRQVFIAIHDALEGDVNEVINSLEAAARLTFRAGDALNWDTFRSVRDTLECRGGDDRGQILALFQRLTSKQD